MTDQSDENKLIAERRKKLDGLRAEQGSPYPNNFNPKNKADSLQQGFGEQSKQQLESLNKVVSVAGRIIRNRGAFIVLQDSSGHIQLYVTKLARPFAKSLDLGDIVGVSGTLHKSGKGELYVEMDDYVLLTKALRPLPDKFHGLADQELRYRQRYVDLIVNPDVRNTFRIRSQVIDFIRRYLNSADYLEVETPMLQVIPGGAVARPFVTHHNALDIDMYLRIAPELYLKRLIVGGFDRVYEINRNFRNEGLSTRHNPEFTMLEFYQAYSDFNDMMDLTEDMIRKMSYEILGTTKITNTIKGQDGQQISETRFDFAKAFSRLSVFESILKYNSDITADKLSNEKTARKIASDMQISIKDTWGLGKIQIEIFEKTVEHQLQQPTFITMYPAEVSPLARRNDKDPFVTDRFEFFVGGREIANGFSELNDPEDQESRFRQQVVEKDAGDNEAMHFDADYIRALEYGMPPTAGEGIGIDRLVMLLTDAPSIRDVLLFPHMRPE
ncbi:MAG: lysine--tRNA ligase [Porticoccaceae bacterium]|nr:lysine--tRNA ligase [Porticoccaceae bacterium]